MKINISLLILIITLFMGSAFTPVSSTNLDWEKLGSKKVSFKIDRDVIRVGANDGLFRKLKVVVTGGSINMHKMIVEYGNGEKDNIVLKHNFTRNSDTRIIDLDGRKRVIKDITFFYDTKTKSRRRATVTVLGGK